VGGVDVKSDKVERGKKKWELGREKRNKIRKGKWKEKKKRKEGRKEEAKGGGKEKKRKKKKL